MVLNFIFQTFILGMKNILLHKLRSLLTTMGIFLGVAAVIVMVAIGEGTKQAAIEQLRQLGARNIVFRTVPPPETGESAARSQSILSYGLKRDDLKKIKANFRFADGSDQDISYPIDSNTPLKYAVPLRDTQFKVFYGDKRVTANAIGSVPEIFEVINLQLERGRYFNRIDVEQGSSVCVLSATVAAQMFPYEDPIGKRITIGDADNGRLFLEVIGVLEKTGLRPDSPIMKRDVDSDVYFPQTLVTRDYVVKRTASSQERKSFELSEIWLQVKDVKDVEQVAAIAENIISPNHQSKDYEMKVPIEVLRAAERTNRLFNFIIGGIAAVSLVVGGIGIMNIMLATVTERTKEIGIRRALGAKQRHITLQFLVETTVVSLTGGLIGVALGCVVALALPPIVVYFSQQTYPTQIAPWSVIGSFGLSGLIGIGFGLYPAMTAARMNPIEALRHE